MVNNWLTEFRCSTGSVDDEVSGFPTEVATPEIIEKINDTMLAHWWLKADEPVEVQFWIITCERERYHKMGAAYALNTQQTQSWQLGSCF